MYLLSKSKSIKIIIQVFCIAGLLTKTVTVASAQSDADLAKKLSNPISSLISLPFQFNYDSDIGPADTGDRLAVNIQPVMPLELNDEWNVISRSILPIMTQEDIFEDSGTQSGTGDLVQSFFFSPKSPTESGWIWGVGPVAALPTASDELLGTEKWSLGPTGVMIKVNGGWTYGVLANHLWSITGDEDRADVNTTFVQPILSHTTSSAITYTATSEATYDWEAEDSALPVNFTIAKVVSLGRQKMSVSGGVRYWLDSTEGGPEGIGFRLMFTLLFPK